MGTYNPGQQGDKYTGTPFNQYVDRKYSPAECPNCPYWQSTSTMATTTTTVRTSTAASICKYSIYGNYTMVPYPENQEITGAFDLQNLPRTSSEAMTRFEIGQRWIIALGEQLYITYNLNISHI